MKKSRLFWRIYLPALLIAAVVAFVMAFYADSCIRETHQKQTERFLLAVTRQFAVEIRRSGLRPESEGISSLCGERAPLTGCRLTVMLRSGKIVADSHENPSMMDNHADRPEVRDAIRDGFGVSVRYSDTMRRKMMYAAVPLSSGDGGDMMVRAAVRLEDENNMLRGFYSGLFALVAMLLAAAAGVAMAVSRRIAAPLDEIRKWAISIAAGAMPESRPHPSGIAEIDGLSSSIEEMTRQLRERIGIITRQHDEQEALLSCMGEGVIAVDLERKVISLNGPVEELFRVKAASCMGRDLVEKIRNSELLELVDRAIGSGEAADGLVEENGKYLQVRCGNLKGGDGQMWGAVVVLTDVTDLKRLENMRRDFVANVSHELKTPVTCIKGFAETLLDGAAEDPENRRRFLGIISQQSERLKTIIEDLLTLSSIEHEGGGRGIELQRAPLAGIVENAMRPYLPKAQEKSIQLRSEVPGGLFVEVNVQLLEQAVSNLLDNAIKYSERGAPVTILAEKLAHEVALRVRDKGPGIAQQHLSRLFERFYRVDKGRSRSLGGTGLGLAIVKGIAVAHGGRVGVDSEPGKGSTFTIFLPKRG